MKKIFNFKKAGCIALAGAMLLGFSGCQNGSAPDINDVKDTYTALIEASFEVNDIFFGKGLKTYDRSTSTGSGDAAYDEATGKYIWVINDSEIGTVIKYYDTVSKSYSFFRKIYLKDVQAYNPAEKFTDEGGEYYLDELKDYKERAAEFVYDENSPVYYDYVRVDEKYQTVNEIKALAAGIYSNSYLESVFTIMFDGMILDNEIIYARYMADESGNTSLLLESNQFEPYFETQTVYDYDSMKIVQPSNGNSVNVKITANGVHIDYDKVEKVTGEYTRTLRFVNENGSWKLDTPTY